jgi:hypothetical protein
MWERTLVILLMLAPGSVIALELNTEWWPGTYVLLLVAALVILGVLLVAASGGR